MTDAQEILRRMEREFHRRRCDLTKLAGAIKFDTGCKPVNNPNP